MIIPVFCGKGRKGSCGPDEIIFGPQYTSARARPAFIWKKTHFDRQTFSHIVQDVRLGLSVVFCSFSSSVCPLQFTREQNSW